MPEITEKQITRHEHPGYLLSMVHINAASSVEPDAILHGMNLKGIVFA